MHATRIAAVDTFVARYPVTAHFRYLPSDAGRAPTRDTVVVKITDESGRSGWGQSVPSPTWSYETMETVRSTIDRHLAPVLIGRDAADIDGIWQAMNRTIAGSFSTGQPIAKAGIDLALHDLGGQVAQQPATHRWGRQGVKPVTLSWTLDPRSVDEVEAEVQAARARGFHHFNLKIGKDRVRSGGLSADSPPRAGSIRVGGCKRRLRSRHRAFRRTEAGEPRRGRL